MKGLCAALQVAVAVMNAMDLAYAPSASAAVDKAKEFATALGTRWGVGHADCNDGVVLLVSRSDRVVYLRTAAGAQKAVSDGSATAITEKMKGYFREGKFDEGIAGGLLV